MLVTPGHDWGLILSSVADGTRPIGAMGAAITPAQNAYGSFATLLSGASLTADAYWIEVCVNTVGILPSGAAARDCVVSLGFDAAGGTSFTGMVDLVVGPASQYAPTTSQMYGGVWFGFPLFIKAGTSIGLAASVNTATLTALNAFCRVYCQPSRPDLLKVGTVIESYGVTLASSRGTSITPGTTSEGTYVDLGTATGSYFFVDFGYGINNATMQNGLIDVDLAIGSASSKKIAIQNAPVMNSANENITRLLSGRYTTVASGDHFYGRAQAGGTLETGHSMAAYGVR